MRLSSEGQACCVRKRQDDRDISATGVARSNEPVHWPRARVPPYPAAVRFFRLASCAIAWILGVAPDSRADSEERWSGPFGGRFHANFTVASDYAQSGISSTQNQPAFQIGIDWHSPYLLENGPLLRLYVAGFGSNVSFPGLGPGVEVDVASGIKLGLLDKRLTIDVGYIRYLYPYYPASSGIEYGEVAMRVDYDFGPLTVSGRVRWSPDTVFDAGQSWNKRVLVTVPLTFVPLPDGMRMKIYGSLGNVWVENPAMLGLPGNDWWYWQIGLVTSVWGLDVMLAYTDTNIEVAGCGYTQACAGRIFASITKVF